MRLTKAGGLAVACLLLQAVCPVDELVSSAAAQSGRSIQILERRGAGRDHPELALVPETGLSQVLVLRVL